MRLKLISRFAPVNESFECVVQCVRVLNKRKRVYNLAFRHWFTVIGLKTEERVRNRFLTEYFMNALIDGDQRDYVADKDAKNMTKTTNCSNRYQVRQKIRTLYAPDKGGHAERRYLGKRIMTVNFNNSTVERKVNHN